jgi:putative Mn2+ efflux pump MntP
MALQKRWQASGVMRIGLASLALANIARWIAQHQGPATEDRADGLVGFLFGIAIGTLLLAVWMNRRSRCQGE